MILFLQFQRPKFITIRPRESEIKFGSKAVAKCNLKKRGGLSEWDVKKINTLYNCPKYNYPHIETIGSKHISILPLHSEEFEKSPRSLDLKEIESMSKIKGRSKENPPPKDSSKSNITPNNGSCKKPNKIQWGANEI